MPNDMSPNTTQVVGGGLDLPSFLAGQSKAWGIFEDRFGTLRRRFVADLQGTWEDGIFVLREDFVFDDGERMHRTWRISPTKNGRFTADADDVIGTALGTTDGETIKLSYQFLLNTGSTDLQVRFHDRFYRVDQNNVMNRATLTKWGIKLGEMSIFFQRANADEGVGEADDGMAQAIHDALDRLPAGPSAS